MKINRAMLSLLDDIENYKINVNSYYEDSSYESFNESVLYSKAKSLGKYLQSIGLTSLSEEINKLDFVNGNCITILEFFKSYIIPEVRRLIEEIDARDSQKNMDKIIELLKYKGRHELAHLLDNSYYRIQESTTYGTYLFSVLSTAEVYSPLATCAKLKTLSANDKKIILDAFLIIYPHKDNSVEINHIEFLVDDNLGNQLDLYHPKEISEINFKYIQEQIKKCNDKIISDDLDGAIANARTLLESICLHILEKNGSDSSHNGDLPKLFKNTLKCFSASKNHSNDNDGFSQMLMGCIAIVNGISRARNVMSDAHGRSSKTYSRPTRQQAIFIVEISKIVSEFIFTAYDEEVNK
jgi:hypothetical protein